MEELYDIRNDSYCLNNLSDLPKYQDIMIQLRERLKTRLKETEDPRVTGNGDVWETYKRFNVMRTFPEPDWDSGNWKIENK
jgi:uncharacterized sulfatase